MTDQEISDRSGLGLDQVKSLSWLCTWDDTTTGLMHLFTRGCGVDFESRPTMQKHLRFVRRMEGKWLTTDHYLRRDEEWETKWQPLLMTYIDFLKSRNVGA